MKKALTNLVLILLSVISVVTLLEVGKRLYDLCNNKENVTKHRSLHPLFKNNELKHDLFSKIPKGHI